MICVLGDKRRQLVQTGPSQAALRHNTHFVQILMAKNGRVQTAQYVSRQLILTLIAVIDTFNANKPGTCEPLSSLKTAY